MSEKKPTYKPQVYAFFFQPMQAIAKKMGYNLLLSGSLNRDMDLVAVPWIDNPKPEIELVRALDMLLRGHCWANETSYYPANKPGGRRSYILSLNRGTISEIGQWIANEDSEWYVDLTITPFVCK